MTGIVEAHRIVATTAVYQFDIMAVKIVHTAIGHLQGTMVPACYIIIIGRVSIALALLLTAVGMGLVAIAHGKQHKEQADDATGQAEPEAASVPLTLSPNGTRGKDLAYLLVLLDDALAVHQSEAMAFAFLYIVLGIRDGLMVKNMGHLLLAHAYPRIANAYLYIAGIALGLDSDRSPTWGELPSVIGQCIQHKQGKRPVGLDHCIRGLNYQGKSLQPKSHLALGHYVKQALQGEALDMQVNLALAQPYPVSQYCVVVVNLVGQLGNVGDTLLAHGLARSTSIIAPKHLHFMQDTVYEWSDTGNQGQLGPLLQIALPILLQMQLRQLCLLCYLLVFFLLAGNMLLIEGFPLAQRFQQSVYRHAAVITAPLDVEHH